MITIPPSEHDFRSRPDLPGWTKQQLGGGGSVASALVKNTRHIFTYGAPLWWCRDGVLACLKHTNRPHLNSSQLCVSLLCVFGRQPHEGKNTLNPCPLGNISSVHVRVSTRFDNHSACSLFQATLLWLKISGQQCVQVAWGPYVHRSGPAQNEEVGVSEMRERGAPLTSCIARSGRVAFCCAWLHPPPSI